MDRQEIFDKVAQHLITQGKPSASYDNEGIKHCLYRGPDGTKCAVGCLIPDEEYSKDIESYRVRHIIEVSLTEGINPVISSFSNDVNLLHDLQKVHDYCDIHEDGTFVHSNLIYRLNEVANNFDLKGLEE